MKNKLNKILLLILIYLGIIIIITTILAFAQKRTRFNSKIPITKTPVEEINNSEMFESFTGLGRIRLSTKVDSKGRNVPLIITPWFSYPKGDEQFFEELSKKSSIIKSIIIFHQRNRIKIKFTITNKSTFSLRTN